MRIKNRVKEVLIVVVSGSMGLVLGLVVETQEEVVWDVSWLTVEEKIYGGIQCRN